MLHTSAPERSPRRTIALLLLVLLAAAGLTFTTAPAASAASDAYVSVEVKPALLTTDVNGNGRYDVGDKASLRVVLRPGDYDLTDIKVSDPTGYWSLADMAAHSVMQFNLGEPIFAANTNDAGEGIFLTSLTLTYTADGASHTLPLETPPLTATSSPLIVGTTTIEYTENTGPVDNAATENDTVRYVTTVTNDTAVTMTVTDPGGAYGGDTFPMTLAAGETVSLHGVPHTVTYGDMVAGGVSWPAATIGWATPDTSGTTGATIPTATTEAIDASADVSVTTTVHTAAGATVALGDAVAGDKIDYTFHVTNTGNVTAQRVYLAAGKFPGALMTYSTSHSSTNLAPGSSLPNAAWPTSRLTSEAAGSPFSPYVLKAADIARGYVDLPFEAAVAPSYAVYDADRPAYTYDLTHRTFLRAFSLAGTLDVAATLTDPNGDGKGQEGEQITYAWEFTNTSDQVVTLTSLADAAGSDAAVGASLAAPVTVGVGGSTTGQFTYTVTAADQARGTVAYGMTAQLTGDADGATTSVSGSAATVQAHAYEAPPMSVWWGLTTDDENGDGKYNAGDTLHMSLWVRNDGTYPLTGVTVTPALSAFPVPYDPFPSTLAPGTSVSRTFDYVMTEADVTAGSARFRASVAADGRAIPYTATAAVVTSPYVTPGTDFTTAATYDDTNTDGSPSIGETAHVTVTVKNTGTYPLTGITLADAGTADAAGDFTGFPSSVAAGATASVTFDHVLTAADFDRGSFTYGATLDATGLTTPRESTAASLGPITFQAYAADLDAMTEGGVEVCDASGQSVTGVTISQSYSVKPASCAFTGDASGFRIVAFSSPLELGADSFDVRIPGRLGVGQHRIALYAPDGTLVGWRAVTVSDPVALAFTGFSSGGLAGLAMLLTLGGVAAVAFAARRRRAG